MLRREDQRFGVCSPSDRHRLADRTIDLFQLVEPAHQGPEVVRFDPGRAIGAVVVAHEVACGLERPPIRARLAFAAAEIVRDEARRRPDAGDVLLQTLLVQVLDIEQQRHALRDGELRRALEHGGGYPGDRFAGRPAPALRVRADDGEVLRALGEPRPPLFGMSGLHDVPSGWDEPRRRAEIASSGTKLPRSGLDRAKNAA